MNADSIKVENYLHKEKLGDKKIASVLRDFVQGYKTLGEICWYHNYSIDIAAGHLKNAGVID